MKIRLTESQYTMVRLINEAEINLSDFNNKMREVEREINIIFKKITFSTVSEFIDGDQDVSVLRDKLAELENKRFIYVKRAYDLINKIPEDEYMSGNYDYDVKIDDVDGRIKQKINVLEKLLASLENAVGNLADRKNINKLFSDIETIQINV